MMGAYPDGDIARASLAQMNEISRRAEVAGMTFSTSASNGGGGSAGGQGGGGPPRPSSRASTIMAAAAGLMPGMDAPARPMSRQDALARIQELTRMRPTPAGDLAQTAGQAQAQASSSSSSSSSPSQAQKARQQQQQQQQQSAQASSSAAAQGPLDAPFDPSTFLMEDAARYGLSVDPTTMNHEGLQVFTVGHLLPRSNLEDENGNWSFDPSALNQVVMPTPEGMGGGPEEEGQSPTAAAPGGRRGNRRGSSMRRRRRPWVRVRVRGGGRRARGRCADDVRARVDGAPAGGARGRREQVFLQIFGGTIDVAVDGVGAVNKMNPRKVRSGVHGACLLPPSLSCLSRD